MDNNKKKEMLNNLAQKLQKSLVGIDLTQEVVKYVDAGLYEDTLTIKDNFGLFIKHLVVEMTTFKQNVKKV